MRLVIGSDDPAPLVDTIVEAARAEGHEVEVLGPPAGGGEEWAQVGEMVARRVADGDADYGVVCCWSGTGVSIAANKVPGVRAALCADVETARMARKYNHANVLALSMRATAQTVGREILEAFLTAPAGEDDFDTRNVAHVEGIPGGDRPG
jgi:ribose 5-phosphate isomerase B